MYAHGVRKVLKKLGLSKAKKEIDQIIENLDYLNIGKVNYTEFMVAAVDLKETNADELLLECLHKFDMDHEGYIGKENLKLALHKLGTATREEIELMVEEYKFLNPEKIYYRELK